MSMKIRVLVQPHPMNARVGTFEMAALSAIRAAWVAAGSPENAETGKGEERLIAVAYGVDDLTRRMRDQARELSDRLAMYADELALSGSAATNRSNPMESSDASRLREMHQERKHTRETFRAIAEVILPPKVYSDMLVALTEMPAISASVAAPRKVG